MQVKTQFFWRTYASYSALLLFGVICFAWLSLKDIRQAELKATDAELKAQVELMSIEVAEVGFYSQLFKIEEKIDSFSGVFDTRFTIIGPQGEVIADSYESAQSMENHLSRPEVQDALARGFGQANRFSQTLQEEYRYYAFAVYSDKDLIGVVRGARSFSSISENIQKRQSLIIRYSLAIMAVGLVLAFFVASRQASIVENIVSVAQTIAEGEFEKRVPVDNAMGLSRLAQGINQMARNSAERVALITADRNRLSAIFAGMDEGVVDVDQEQRIIHINTAAAKMLGVNELNCVGNLVWQEIRDNEVIDAIDQVIRTRSVIKTQASLSRSNSIMGEGVIDIYAASLSDDDGEPMGAIVVLNDVTEIKNLERVRTDFVANASHELKTPITAIRGLSETVLEDEKSDQDMAFQFMERIRAQSIRLSELVGDLITISRLESSQTKSEFCRINMSELVKRGVKMAESAKSEKNQVLSLSLPKSDIEVFGDYQNLSQLVDNLISNAIKYTPEDGEINVSLARDGFDMVLKVADNGIGIGPQYIQRVFERFYRVDKARSQSLGGTGLGLSIVKNIAEKHSGSVGLESQLGNGSVFTFRMKIASI